MPTCKNSSVWDADHNKYEISCTGHQNNSCVIHEKTSLYIANLKERVKPRAKNAMKKKTTFQSINENSHVHTTRRDRPTTLPLGVKPAGEASAMANGWM